MKYEVIKCVKSDYKVLAVALRERKPRLVRSHEVRGWRERAPSAAV